MHEQDREAAARRLGMKVSEVVDVVEAKAGGAVITTHDGQKVFAPDEGPVRPWEGDPPIVPAEPVQDSEPASDDGTGGPYIRFDLAAVPDGSAADVLTWVDGEPDRARRALEVETGKEKPRTSLVAQLEKLAQG